jgi:hypothetical protein
MAQLQRLAIAAHSFATMSIAPDAFSLTRVEMRTGPTAALADSLATPQLAGAVVSLQSGKDKDGVFRTQKQTRVATAQAAARAPGGTTSAR